MKYIFSYIPSVVVYLFACQYVLMYWLGLPEKTQWYVYDLGNSIAIFILTLYIFFLFKNGNFEFEKTKNKIPISCAVVITAYSVVSEILNINVKNNYGEVIFIVLITISLTLITNLWKKILKIF